MQPLASLSAPVQRYHRGVVACCTLLVLLCVTLAHGQDIDHAELPQPDHLSRVAQRRGTPERATSAAELGPHYERHMMFRHVQQEQRIREWHELLRQRSADRSMVQRASWGETVRQAVDGATDPGDKQVLLDLYESTGGQDWTSNKGWANKTSDPCSVPWTGIYCQNNRVASIEMVYNNLAGPLPQSLGKLTALQQLVLYSNLITGELPSGLFDLPALVELDVNNNQLTGTLPSRVTAKSLQHLVLYTNKFRGPLPTEWHAPNMQTVELSSNSFTGPAPDGFGLMPSLKELVVSRNNLSGPFPASWGSLHNLTQLWTFDNTLKGPLDSSWAKMRSLQNVEMDGVTGEMPSWIGDWNKLTLFILARGAISGVLPDGICKLKRVQTLWLFLNSMSGQLPSCLGDLNSVQQLELSDNHFSGAIPQSVGQLGQLQYLYLSRNSLSGELPSSLGDLKNLQIMDLSSNEIVGAIPESFNKLAGIMVNWALCYNKLSGPLTETLQPLFKAISQFTCALYNNPWQCPIETVVPKECDCVCDTCNSAANRQSCSKCVASGDGCGFCQDGESCLHGDQRGPQDYTCSKWDFGTTTNCTVEV
ncbi:uncharacterized protein LOC135828946 [Sycon ciliatum]|uniref:uncharacterized protein LOC135828946 n=1 Tax=Sycon ciliatum TaxID=27933 RepID=UPI0031F6232E